MPLLWDIRCYVSPRGVDEIRAWYNDQSERVQAKFQIRLRFLAQTPRSGWKREPFDLLHNCQGIGEIRFSADKVEHRPLGFFSPRNVFTIVICAQEKNSRFVPKTACQIALARKKEIEADDRRSKPCDFPLE